MLTSLVSMSPSGEAANGFMLRPAISADGRYITFMSCASNFVPGDNNQLCDIFVKDLLTGKITIASIPSN